MSKINLESETLVECLLRQGHAPLAVTDQIIRYITFSQLMLMILNHHVADVPNEDHYERLLSIREVVEPITMKTTNLLKSPQLIQKPKILIQK
ncbi:hypothetical protein BANRA_04028 [Acinetobacter baumannii]|nr:hypothetical protein BANRA_04028 [Acinetobacter baumannii]